MEEEVEITELGYNKYFDEYFPITKEEVKQHGFKHTYTVSVHRAMYTDESFEIYQKYQARY